MHGIPSELVISFVMFSRNMDKQLIFFFFRSNSVENTKKLPSSKIKYLTLLHSLTGPVGQPFASRLGGERFMSRGSTSSPVSVVSLHW